MAKIQQSLNQALYTGTVAAGLYAHSPKGQTKAKINTKEREINTINQKIEQGLATENVDYSKRAELANEIFELDPTQKNLDVSEEYSGEAQKRIEQLRNQKERFEMRKKLLEGAPEVPTKKVKIMEV
jgi:hypothetical protein